MDEFSVGSIFDRMVDIPEFIGKSMDDVNVVGNFGNTPLHVGAGWGDVQVITGLVRAGADVDAVGEEGMTPLHRAASAGHSSAVEVLLGFGANALARDAAGHTACDLALILNRYDVIKCLDKPRSSPSLSEK